MGVIFLSLCDNSRVVAVLMPAFPLTGISLWVHLSTAGLVALALILTLRRNPRPSFGLEGMIPFGPMFFAVPFAVFGMQHFVLFDSVKFAVPAWMPERFLWAYIVGAALILACLSIVTEIKADLAALLLGIMLNLFVLMIYLPNLMNNPHDRFAMSAPSRDLALSGGAFAMYAAAAPGRRRPISWVGGIGRWLFGVPVIYFGIEHFLHPDFAPGVPFPQLMPPWIPGHSIWANAVGTALIASGICILANRGSSAAATWLGIVYLLLVFFIYIPMEVAHPSIAMSGELDYVADTLAMSGAALLVANAIEKRSANSEGLRESPKGNEVFFSKERASSVKLNMQRRKRAQRA
jgi:uncharacterized membrane protein